MATTDEMAADIRERTEFLVEHHRSILDRTEGLEGLREELSGHAADCAAALVAADPAGPTVANRLASADVAEIEDMAQRRFVLAYPSEGTKDVLRDRTPDDLCEALGADEYPVAEDEWACLGMYVDGDRRAPENYLDAFIKPDTTEAG